MSLKILFLYSANVQVLCPDVDCLQAMTVLIQVTTPILKKQIDFKQQKQADEITRMLMKQCLLFRAAII